MGKPESKERKLTLKTREGSIRLLWLFIVIILVASLAARLVTTDFGSIHVEKITIDARGGTLDAELYYPLGTSDRDSLPAVLVAHGGAVEKGFVKCYAQELARRGFVALNVTSYGAGMSEMPPYDESNQDQDTYEWNVGPVGMQDALEFVRTLKFVDQTRIGMAGHSIGGIRAGYVAQYDGYYYSYNDLLINILYDTFGEEFTEEEIAMDAEVLAAERLNADQLEYFNALAAQARESYDTRIKAICTMAYPDPINTPPTSSDPDAMLERFSFPTPYYVDAVKAVVAGHYVERTNKVNTGLSIAGIDPHLQGSTEEWLSRKDVLEVFQVAEGSVVADVWYALDDSTGTSIQLGEIDPNSIGGNAEVTEAAENRSLRMCMFTAETHSKVYFSTQTTANMVYFMEEALEHTSGLSPSNQTWPLRAAFNCIAMLAMIAMAFPLVALLVRKKTFTPCVGAVSIDGSQGTFKMKSYWITGAITAVVTALVMLYTNWFPRIKLNEAGLAQNRLFPMFNNANLPQVYMGTLAIFGIILLVFFVHQSKKLTGKSGMDRLNINLGVSGILKSLLIGVILVGAAYGMLMIVEYLFAEDFRLWQTVFTEMKVEMWFRSIIYIIILIPLYGVSGAVINYTVRKDIPEWKDNLIIVLINSIGPWVAFGISWIYLLNTHFDGSLTFPWWNTASFMLIIPVTVYISRKMYRLTNSIWVGATFNSILVMWTLASQSGGSWYYLAQNFFTTVFAK